MAKQVVRPDCHWSGFVFNRADADRTYLVALGSADVVSDLSPV